MSTGNMSQSPLYSLPDSPRAGLPFDELNLSRNAYHLVKYGEPLPDGGKTLPLTPAALPDTGNTPILKELRARERITDSRMRGGTGFHDSKGPEKKKKIALPIKVSAAGPFWVFEAANAERQRPQQERERTST